MTNQYRYKCCNRIYHRNSRTGNTLPLDCPFCQCKNAGVEEVDKEDLVINVGTGYSGDEQYEKRPWGSFRILLDEPNVKVKKITVKPSQKLSVQLHRFRDEWWKIICGEGKIQINSDVFTVSQSDTVEIKKYEVHAVENTGDIDLVFVEIQTGVCKESDIVRIEDEYGRTSGE